MRPTAHVEKLGALLDAVIESLLLHGFEIGGGVGSGERDFAAVLGDAADDLHHEVLLDFGWGVHFIL